MRLNILLFLFFFSVAVMAQETGPANSVIRVPSGGGRASAGSIDLSTSAAVGSSVLSMTNGGSNKALTAVAGGMCYSDANSLEILAAGSSGQVLRSGGSSSPAWSTATYPATATGTGTILRADGTNWIASTATYPTTVTAPSVMVGNTNDVFSALSGSTGNRLLKTNGSAISFAQADLTTDVTGVLPIANGGSNKALTLAAGGVLWTDADSFEVSAAGTTGKALISGGTGAPTWFTPTAGSVLFAGTSGILQQDNTNFFFDDTNNRLGVGISTPANKIHQDNGNATANYHQFTVGSTTNTSASDGFLVGADATGKAIINQQESAALGIYTAGTERMTIASGGDVSFLSTTDSSSVTTGSVSTAGGLGVAKAIWAGSNIILNTSGFIGRGTTDASDNGYIVLSGGGAASTTRGANIYVYGNEHASAGQVAVAGGSTATDIFAVTTSGGTEKLVVTTSNGTEIVGTTTNDSASAGYVGEIQADTNSAATFTGGATFPNSATNGCGAESITLTAGDWDVEANIAVKDNSTGSVTSGLELWISTTVNTQTGLLIGQNYGTSGHLAYVAYSLFNGWTAKTPIWRVSISATTSYYLGCRMTYSGTAPTYLHSLRARRVR